MNETLQTRNRHTMCVRVVCEPLFSLLTSNYVIKESDLSMRKFE